MYKNNPAQILCDYLRSEDIKFVLINKVRNPVHIQLPEVMYFTGKRKNGTHLCNYSGNEN